MPRDLNLLEAHKETHFNVIFSFLFEGLATFMIVARPRSSMHTCLQAYATTTVSYLLRCMDCMHI